MAAQDKSKSALNANLPDNYKNKVYINPKFNNPHINNLPSNNSIMHLNPKFSHLVSNLQSKSQNINKIYVNPNFIKSKSVRDQSISSSANDNSIADKTSTSVITCHPQSADQNCSVHVPTGKSRYCLVRQNVTNKILTESVPQEPKNTFKLNKYKSVPWNEIKRNLGNFKNARNNKSTAALSVNTNTQINKKSSCLSVHTIRSKNEFKLINYNNVSSVKQDSIQTQVHIEAHTKLYKSNHLNQSRVKKIKGNLKKNNIPCPLFRKFGKCLRNARGRCEFLHDKKHVSICRKFIKGLCHDKDCLLSHDLTTKKMPTCYFYLQGTCTKADCAYLHVKLNEKAKVCSDFLNGYCEKGSKCLQRHIDILTREKNKRNSQTKKSSSRNKNNELKIIKDVNLYHKGRGLSQNIEQEIKSEKHGKSVVVKSDNCSDCRYYQEQDDASINETCEIIKPMRCKLGTLPSFIQL